MKTDTETCREIQSIGQREVDGVKYDGLTLALDEEKSREVGFGANYGYNLG